MQGRAKPLLLNSTSEHYGNKWWRKILGKTSHFRFILQGGGGEKTNQERWISKCNLVLLNAILINANSVEGYVAWILGTSNYGERTGNVHGQWP
jgi:hypothetical protein